MSSERRVTHWSWLGRVPHAPTAELQRFVREELGSGAGPERLLLLEHGSVYTLGRNAGPEDVLLSASELALRGVEVVETDRGGQVTYHGPGQLVGYPILDLSPDRRDLRRYVRDLQSVLVATLADFGVVAAGGEGERIGVWTSSGGGSGGEPRKIASIGIHLARWRTTHGFALNVDPDLGLFGGIVACGLPGVEMTSIEREVRGASASSSSPASSPSSLGAPALQEVATRVRVHFAERFARELVEDLEFAAFAGERLSTEVAR